MSIRSIAAALSLTVVTALATVPSRAAVLFQSIPDLGVAPFENAWCSTCSGSYAAYDAFSLGFASNIDLFSLTVQTSYFFPTPITVSIYSDAGGQAGVSLYNQVFSIAEFASVTNTAFDTSIVTLNPAGLSLGAGSYYFSFSNAENLGAPGYLGGSGDLYQSAGIGLTDPVYTFGDQSLGFALSGDAGGVPEPSTWMMFILGFGTIGYMLRKRRQVALAA